MTDMNELREKVARAIKPHLSDDFPLVNYWANDIADAAIATVMEATGWQDIAKPPTVIVQNVIFYTPPQECDEVFDGLDYRYNLGQWRKPEHRHLSGWHEQGTNHDIFENEWNQPTHFMPLPPPPFEGTKHD